MAESKAAQPQFIHLHTHSAYSLAEGATQVKDLVKRVSLFDMPAVAITDTNNLFGALEFAQTAQKSGIQPIIGSQVALGHERHELVLLVQTEQGYRNLCKLISRCFLSKDEDHSSVSASWADIEECSEGLICLTGGLNGVVSQYLLHNQEKDAVKALKRLKDIYGDRLYVEIQRHNLPEQHRIEGQLVALADKFALPLVATNNCYFTSRDMHQAHDALLCIADGRYITESDRRKETPEHYIKSQEEMVSLFHDLPDAIQNTIEIAKRCSFLLESIKPILPPFEVESGASEEEQIREGSKAGLKWRLDNFVFTPEMSESEREEISKPYWERLDFELETIIQMGFPGYFLIVSDFIKWAKDHDIPVGPGRGSGAGSVVAWALKITDLDPLEFNLLFERFLNPERVSMPDFDVDFCQERRDEVITYVQEKYGYDRVAQIITFGKLQARAVVRDVGRVLQMPYGQVDRLAKMIPSNPANPVTLQEALDQDPDLVAEIDKDETSAKLIDIALKLEGLYRHASTHAAGVVIGDRPLHELIPLYRDPRSDMPVTQFNMKYVEQAGLVKFDFLGLKTLTVIQKAVELVKETDGKDIDILKIPFDDDVTYEMLARGETIGVFQLESAGMRDLGKQMRISNFEQIIALVALYRPGPMENIPKYLACLHGQEERDFMHPKLQPILEDTYGVMIYQEQVMQAAQILSGYSLGGADLLRRAMGKKIKEEMDSQRQMFVEGASEASEVGSDQANLIFDQIAKFAGYGFNKAHSAGYALVSYWTAWLKANYPVQFMAASMTLDLGNTDKLSVFRQELIRMGIELLQPDINHSYSDFAVENKNVRYALGALKGVGASSMKLLTSERDKNGAFKDIFDVAERIDPRSLNKKTIEMLASAGAFECFGHTRSSIYEMAEYVLRYSHNVNDERNSGQESLFGAGSAAHDPSANRPPVPDVKEWSPLEKLRHEFEAVGFYLSAHPLDGQRETLEKNNVVFYTDLAMRMETTTAARLRFAGVLIRKQERVSAKSGNKFAFLTISDPTGVFETVIFSETLALGREFLNPGQSLMVTIDVESKEDQLRMTGVSVEKLDDAIDRMRRTTTVSLSSLEQVEELKRRFDTLPGGAAKIMIKMPGPQNTSVSIALPEYKSFPPGFADTLHEISCVNSVQEK